MREEKQPKVRSSQIQRQILASLSSRGELRHVGDVGLDVGGGVCVPAQAPVNLHDHSLLYLLQMLVTEVFRVNPGN